MTDLQTFAQATFFILVYCVPVLVRGSGRARGSQLSQSKQLAGCLAEDWCSSLALSRTRWNLWRRQMMVRWSLSAETAVARARRNAFLISKACFHLLWGWGAGQWLPGGVYFLSLRFTYKASEQGVALAVFEISFKIPIDVMMGVSQAFLTTRSSCTDENVCGFLIKCCSS